jgi:hypothetical protein
MAPLWTLRLASAGFALLIGCFAAVAVALLCYGCFFALGTKPSMPQSNIVWLISGFAAGLATLDLYRHMMKLRDIW